MSSIWTRKFPLFVGFAALACGGATTDDVLDGIEADGSGAGEGTFGEGSGGQSAGGPGSGGRPTSDGGGGSSAGAPSTGGEGASGGVGSDGGSGGRPPDCPGATAVPGTAALYDRAAASAANGTADFFRFPWPELSRDLSELGGFPNPAGATGCEPAVTAGLVGLLVDAVSSTDYRDYLIALADRHLREPSRRPNIYMAFDGPLSPGSLPEAAETLSRDSPVLLMNVDAGSPERGSLVPLRLRIYTDSLYLPDSTLAASPVPGFPLQPNTRYAFVVRRSLGDASGAELGSSADFEARKVDCPGVATDYLAAFEELASVELPPDEIAAMTVFETGDPTRAFRDLGGVIAYDVPSEQEALAPQGPATDLTASGGYYVVGGSFMTPFSQQGTPPYLPKIGGTLTGLTVDLDPESLAGDFVGDGVSRWEPVDFSLTLPASALEADPIKVPVVIYGAGTGGSRNSAIDLGIAGVLSELGIAVFSTTPVLHAQRAHSDNVDAELLMQTTQIDTLAGTNYTGELITTVESGNLFFNPLNLAAARGNAMQAGVDFLWQARLLANASFEVEIAGQMREVRFDAQHVYFFGHSQGAGAGPMLADSPDLRGALLSGASGHIPAVVLDKTKPVDQVDISQMIDYIVCDSPSEPLDITHPFMGLLGHWFEPSDAELYAGNFTSGPIPKSVFVLVGRDDAYAPPASNDAITTALLLNEVTPDAGFSARSVRGQHLLSLVHPGAGYGETASGVGSNLNGVTAAFKQYHDEGCSDDHFTYVCNASAVTDWLAYFATSLDGTPIVP